MGSGGGRGRVELTHTLLPRRWSAYHTRRSADHGPLAQYGEVRSADKGFASSPGR